MAEMSFEDFSNMFTPSNNFGQPVQLPASGGPGGGMQSSLQTASSQENLQNALPGLFADGGVAGLLGERTGFDGGGSPLQRLRQEIVDSMRPYAPDYITEDQLQLVVKDITLDMTAEQAQESAKANFIKLFGMAEGGRVPFAMGRRAFLKLLGVGGAGIGALKTGIGLGGKKAATEVATKAVPIVKTDPVPGKPEWFDALVNKVIREGDDVTRNFQTKEREIVHAAKIDEDNYVRVTQDLDQGTVRVEYDSDTNVFGDTVQLQYKKPLPDQGDPRPTAEFTTAESGPVGRSRGPDDYEIDVDEVGGSSIRDLDSDVSKLKEYATGKKPTMKEIVQNKKRKDRAAAITDDPEAQSDAIIRRQGEYDGPYEDDFASGGIARMLGE